MSANQYPPAEGSNPLCMIQIGGYTYPANIWHFEMLCGQFAVPSLASVPFRGIMSGLRSAAISAAGQVRTGFNPFIAPRQHILGSRQGIICRVNGEQIASCPTALIVQWVYDADSNGLVDFNLGAVGSWRFTDFGGTYVK